MTYKMKTVTNGVNDFLYELKYSEIKSATDMHEGMRIFKNILDCCMKEGIIKDFDKDMLEYMFNKSYKSKIGVIDEVKEEYNFDDYKEQVACDKEAIPSEYL